VCPRTKEQRQNATASVSYPEATEDAIVAASALLSLADWLRRKRSTQGEQPCNAARLRQNRTTATTRGTARQGIALLTGLVFCGRCGRRKGVLYNSTSRPRYECVTHLQPGEARTCPGINAEALDACVGEQVLRVLTPAGIELSLTAAGDIERERGRLDEHWRAELERAGYEARLAERSYRAVDRALLERVTVTMPGDAENVVVRIRWIGGTSNEHVLRRPISRYERLTDFPQMRKLVAAAVAAGENATQIADCLDRAGFRPPSSRADRFTPERARDLVYRLGLSQRRRPNESLAVHHWCIRDLADELGVGYNRF
jgi:Recombinase zinc beta ribbon domain